MFLSPRSLVFAAFRSGGLYTVTVRPSTHARSGWVAVCTFRTEEACARFARQQSARLGIAVAIRGQVSCSVPCSPAPSHFPGLGFPVAAIGGLRVLCRSLAVAGLR